MTSKHFFFNHLKQFLRCVRQSKSFYNSPNILENIKSFGPFWAATKKFLWTLLRVSVDVIKSRTKSSLERRECMRLMRSDHTPS